MTPPDTPRPSFGDFHASKSAPESFLDRATFRGQTIEEAVSRMLAFVEEKKDLQGITKRQKRVVLSKVLKDFSEKDLNIGTVNEADVAAYRAYLRSLVEDGVISQSYAGHICIQWNSTMRTVFGEKSQAGSGLIMRGFQQHPKKVKHLTEADFRAMRTAVEEQRFKTDHYRKAFLAYLEVVWSTGARVGSLLSPRCTAGDIDWENQTMRLRHMKNVDEHTVVLSKRATEHLHEFVAYLRTLRVWRGKDTPLFINTDGKMLTNKWCNDALKMAAARAGVNKLVTTHVFRKSVGTLMARDNPKLAQEQLGISEEIFNRHYNQPLLEDRLERRDLLPGDGYKPMTPMERIGEAFVEYEEGKITEAELVEIRRLAKAQATKPGTGADEDMSFQ